jgi:hypothetical protein
LSVEIKPGVMRTQKSEIKVSRGTSRSQATINLIPSVKVFSFRELKFTGNLFCVYLENLIEHIL